MKKLWTCDYKGCEEIAQWYRKWKGELLTLCTTHEGYFGRKHWGKHLDVTKLDEDDIRYLERKELRKELVKKKPFEVLLFPLENGTTKVRVVDKQTDETRSFVIKDSDHETFSETYRDLERKGFSSKPSIDDYVKRLRKGVFEDKRKE